VRFSRVTKILVASAATVALTASGASAVEVSASAVATGARLVAPATVRSVSGTTITTIKASRKVVKKGRRVRISGTVNSGVLECQSLSSATAGVGKVQIKAGAKTYTVSLNTGTYKKGIKLRRSTTFQATFLGAAFGVHPNDVSCTGSTSGKVRVRAKR